MISADGGNPEFQNRPLALLLSCILRTILIHAPSIPSTPRASPHAAQGRHQRLSPPPHILRVLFFPAARVHLPAIDQDAVQACRTAGGGGDFLQMK